MSNVLNLITYGNPEFKFKRKSKNTVLPTLPPEASKFLQVLPVSEAPIVTCCCLKDVGNKLNKGQIQGPFSTYRVSMMTLPKSISYVDYTIKGENNSKIDIQLINPPLSFTFQTLLILDINTPVTNFHYCEDTNKSDDAIVSSTIACVDTLTSLRGSDFKPFHIFSMKISTTKGFYPTFNAKKTITGQVYLVPFAISEGVVVYFIIDGTPNQQQKTLDTLSEEIKKTQGINDGKHHWFINSEIIYQDAYGVFTCTCVMSSRIGAEPIGDFPI